MVADLVRGAGGGTFSVFGGKGHGKTKGRADLGLEEIAGGKVMLSKDVSIHYSCELSLNMLKTC